MNVLLVAPYRQTGAGGVSTVVHRLREALELHGQKALLLVAGDSDGVTPVSDPGRRGTFEIYLRGMCVRGAAMRGALAFWAFLPRTLWSLRQFLERENIQIVHVHFPTPLSLYFATLRVFSHWKFLVTVHGTDVYALPRRSRLHRALIAGVLARADLITGASNDLLHALAATYPRLRTRRCVIPNGNPLTISSATQASRGLPAGLPRAHVLAVGSLIPRKGYDVLLRSVRLVCDQGYDMNLVILGRGPEASTLAALARALGVHDRVLFAGEVPHEAVRAFYSGAEFFVHAPREEAFGLVLLEAMACRKAVIATRVNGIPEIVRHEETGLLVEPEDPESLAAAIIRLIKDTDLRASLATAGHAFVTCERTWDRFTQQYIRLYAGALDGTSGSGAM